MNTDNYNKALGLLVLYRRMAMVAKRGTPTYTTYIDKLDAGYSILSMVFDKDSDEVHREVREAYDSKYRC